jgi:hypothetical protein
MHLSPAKYESNEETYDRGKSAEVRGDMAAAAAVANEILHRFGLTLESLFSEVEMGGIDYDKVGERLTIGEVFRDSANS